MQTIVWLETLWQDLRYSLRQLVNKLRTENPAGVTS